MWTNSIKQVETEVGDAMIRAPKVLDEAASAADAKSLLVDDHTHLVLVVDRHGTLVTTIERADLGHSLEDATPARVLGRVVGRTVSPATSVRDALAVMEGSHRRRLAVVDEAGKLLGLLCLKRSGNGFCSDADVRSRRVGVPFQQRRT